MRPKSTGTWFLAGGFLAIATLSAEIHLIVGVIVFGAAGLLQTLYQFRHYDMSHADISYHTFLGAKSIAWGEVTSVRYVGASVGGLYSAPTPGYFFIDGLDQNQPGASKSLGIPITFGNILVFAQIVLAKVSPEHIEHAARDKLTELTAQT